jgi:flagellar biosynthetic protein FliR
MGMGIFWVGLADMLSHYQALASDALQWLRDLARAR